MYSSGQDWLLHLLGAQLYFSAVFIYSTIDSLHIILLPCARSFHVALNASHL